MLPPEARLLDSSADPLAWDPAFQASVLGRIAQAGAAIEVRLPSPA